jgi:SulP family sulfate permease
MAYRAHLFSLRLGHAVREACIAEPYGKQRFLRDLMAGVTVGIIATPLAMALAIASGAPPQHGLYTAIIAGFLIALTGGSRYSISGPTAAFVVILHPVAVKYGLGGLLVATVLSGVILVIMANLRMGRFIEYIPESVTLGFTGGIAVVIATLQLNDLLGLGLGEMPEHFMEKLFFITENLERLHWPSVGIALLTFAILLLWPLFKTPIPPHLPAVVIASLAAWELNQLGHAVDTIGSRFHYLLADGTTGSGIPALLPHFSWPWQQAGADGQPLAFSWNLARDMITAAFAMAMLGAIESLLCAVILDGMSGKRHSANSELLGQGIGNIVAPFFGGFTATAAIARSAVNVKAGAESPVAAMVHALLVLLALLVLAGALSFLPMPALAALLMVVAWNMSEAHKSVSFLGKGSRSEILVFATCFSLTVLFDMVIAITTGVLLAAILFMKEIAEMTKLTEITDDRHLIPAALPAGWRGFKVTGPLFFAAADRIFGELAQKADECRGIVLYLDGVSLLDSGGLSAMTRLMDQCRKSGTELWFTEWQVQPLRTLSHANIAPEDELCHFSATLPEALAILHSRRGQNEKNP